MSGKHTHAHERGAARHRTVIVGLLVLAVVAVAALGVALWRRVETGGCPSADVALAADPSIAPTLQKVLDDRGCDSIEVKARDTASVVTDLGRNDGPDLWVPAWSGWAAQVDAPVVVRSLASSPVVLASTGSSAPSTWSAAIASPGFVSGDPRQDAVAAAPILGAAAEAADAGRTTAQESAALVPLSVGFSDGRAITDAGARVHQLAGRDGSTAVSEQTALSAGVSGVRLSTPTSGALWLDYPVALTAAVSRRADAKAAATWLADTMTDSAAESQLTRADFRNPDHAPLPDRGVGTVERALQPQPAQVKQALTTFARLALPTRALAVLDVSGSMGFAAGASTRMQVTVNAALAGVSLFPDTASIGLWEFSQHLDGDRDYRKLVPIRPLSATAGGVAQKQALVAALSRVAAVPGTSTGLYDTTLAAFREVKKHWDPDAVNSVLLFTDGENEDPGSIGLPQLLKALHEEQDPAKPVIIIGIGISQDADAAALAKISKATGGSSYVARDPADIGRVFQEAIGKRAG